MCIRDSPLKCEYFLPLVVTELIEENKAKIQVLRLSLIHISCPASEQENCRVGLP